MIKTFKPTTPSRRHMTVSGFDGDAYFVCKTVVHANSITNMRNLRKDFARAIPSAKRISRFLLQNPFFVVQ